MLRQIAILCVGVVFMLPAALTAFRGANRFGFNTWQEALHVDTPMGICIWSIFAIWMIYPIFRKMTESTELYHKKA